MFGAFRLNEQDAKLAVVVLKLAFDGNMLPLVSLENIGIADVPKGILICYQDFAIQADCACHGDGFWAHFLRAWGLVLRALPRSGEGKEYKDSRGDQCHSSRHFFTRFHQLGAPIDLPGQNLKLSAHGNGN